MLSLGDARAEHWITLPSSGARVKLRSLSGAEYFAAQQAAVARSREMALPPPDESASEEEKARAAERETLPDGLDRENPAHILGLGLSLFAQEFARLAVTDWKREDSAEDDSDGVYSGIAEECTPENAALLAAQFAHDGEAIRTAIEARGRPAIQSEASEGNA